MEKALHDPQHGYYARRISAVGKRGDFTTAPMLSDTLARAVTKWVIRAMAECGCRNLIEVGPGEGTLAASVLKHFPWHLRWRTRLHLVETSAPLVERQRELLGNRATWHCDIRQALAACGGQALIYSNELVDAFPVRRFQNTPLGWQELAVENSNGYTRESLLPTDLLPDSSGFLDSHPLGQWIEVHDSYRRHLTGWLPLWKSGRMLTIDYGARAENLYQRRPMGTIRAYLLQQRLEGPAIYQNPGRQDLTADVNFTDLVNWSKPWMESIQLMDYQEFLQHADLADELQIGDAFLVLDQKRSSVNLLTHS